MNRGKFLFVLVFLFCGSVYGGDWSITGSTNASRGGFNTVTFTDGKIMVFGGMATGASNSYEIYDPSTGNWAITYLDTIFGSYNDHSTGILMSNGAGLFESSRRQLFTYNPITSSWFQTRWWPNTGAGSMYECVTLLKSGKVLLIGHPYGRYCYIYEWSNDTLYQVGNMSGSSSMDEHCWAAEVLLPNGKAMIIGGSRLDLTPRADCEIYDEASGTWSMADSMNKTRTKLVAVLLRPPYQKVLVVDSGQSELYDYVTDQWSYTGALNITPRLIASMCLLPNGKALIIGGSDLKSCEIYDPASGVWTVTTSMTVGRWHATSAILPTGKVIAMGDEGATSDQRCEIYDPIDGSWTSQASLQTARIAPAITLLPAFAPDYSTNVLIVGGDDGSGTALSSCELFNFKENTTVLTGSMNTARTHHTINLLPDVNGTVLVAGGKSIGGALASCEIYNVAAGTWTNTSSLNNARFDHTATLLKDGRVLVTGGESSGGYTNTCEIWNGSSWTSTGSMTTSRARHSAILLLNGKVMVIGGETTSGTIINSCEIYDPATGNWSSTPNISTGRSLHASVLLQSGNILIIGGENSSGSPLTSCEIYVPDSSLWRAVGSLNIARYAHNATLTYAGLVFVSGGTGDLSSCEIYDPATDEWKNTGTLTNGKSYHASVLVPYLHPYVYAIGGSKGSSALNSIERFDFGLGYQSDWQSRILNYPSVTHIADSMSILGSLFRDFSEGDGGNYCHITSTDHPIISLVRIGGGNWQGNGGGDILHMPLSSYWDTSHTTVHPQVSDFEGYYRIWSIVNGIPSKWPSSTGIEELSQNSKVKTQIEISPNPFIETAGIRGLGFGVGKDKIKIYDVSGKLVEKTEKTIIGKNLKAGIYFVRIGDSKPTKIVKLNRLK